MVSLNWGPFLLVLVGTLAEGENTVRYDGYHLFRTTPKNRFQVERLATLRNDSQVDFWIEPRTPGLPVDILVSQERVPSLKTFLVQSKLPFRVIVHDVQTTIRSIATTRAPKMTSAFDWGRYHTLDTIDDWLTEQARTYKAIATIVTAGRSAEGRSLRGLLIAHKSNQPIVFVEAGIHAREWIAPATAMWFIQQALSSSTSDLITSYEWHVFPSVNPDGYVYSYTTDRLWRKNRNGAHAHTHSCFGVDINRNWPRGWKESPLSSFPECSEVFSGPHPASEPETEGLLHYLNSIAPRVRVYISLHSYGPYLLYPWSYTDKISPATSSRLNYVANKAAGKMFSRYGTLYKVGQSATLLYTASGTSLDYAYSINVSYPFLLELRGHGGGVLGFLLPEQEIIPTATEAFDAVTVILEEAQMMSFSCSYSTHSFHHLCLFHLLQGLFSFKILSR